MCTWMLWSDQGCEKNMKNKYACTHGQRERERGVVHSFSCMHDCIQFVGICMICWTNWDSAPTTVCIKSRAFSCCGTAFRVQFITLTLFCTGTSILVCLTLLSRLFLLTSTDCTWNLDFGFSYGLTNTPELSNPEDTSAVLTHWLIDGRRRRRRRRHHRHHHHHHHHHRNKYEGINIYFTICHID